MAERLRLLVVDDEPPARARLLRLLATLDGVQVVGQAGDGLQALALVDTLQPDVLLLDVQMPEVGGLDVAASLPDDGPAVVFVTAHDAYALQAFDTAAVDYLLKPVDPARLVRAIDRVRLRVWGRHPAPARPPADRLVVSERGRLQVIPRGDVLWLQAADNYVELHTAAGLRLLRRTLEGLLADLGPGFVRIHRSRAVALSAVAGVAAAGKGDALVRLHGGQVVGCSRAHRAALVQALAGAKPPA